MNPSEQTPAPPDPLASVSDEAQRVRGSLWWSHPSNKTARSSQGGLEDNVRALLELGEWEDTPGCGRKTSRSIMAWRGLWVEPNLPAIEQALDEGLAPQDNLDWWALTFFRTKALKMVFLPGYPAPTAASSASVWSEYEKFEETRKRVAGKLHARAPQLLGWMLQSLGPTKSLYSHPLMICARPGMEEEFARLSSVMDPGVVFLESGVAPIKLLETGIKRQFQPLIDLALEAGAHVDDPVLDFRQAERSLLHAAIASANPAAVDWVLQRNPRLETWDRLGHTPFLVAARQADMATMEKLAARGANAHAVDRFGRTAAHLVADSVRTQELDMEEWKKFGDRKYVNRDPEDIEKSLVRAGQALATLERLGVDLSIPCGPTPKNTKKSPSPFALLPRANRPSFAAKPGETWEDHLARRCAEDPLLGEKHLACLRAAKLEVSLAAVPPEPEEGEEGPAPTSSPPLRPRPRM